MNTENLPKIVSFSGGRTSGLMLRKLIDANPDFDERFQVIFENTGKEHDATLDFINEVSIRWGVPITWLEYTRVPATEIHPQLVPEGRKRANLLKAQEEGKGAHWFRVVDYKTAARRFDKRTPFDELLEWSKGLPNVRTRRCSVQMKIRTRDRYLRAAGTGKFVSFIGIRKDEEHRKHEILCNCDQYEAPQFPLCDDGTTQADVNAFWKAQPFDLKIPNLMGNCDLCFLKARWKRLALAEAEPHAAQWWADWEQRFSQDGASDNASTFRLGESYAGLIHEATQPRLPFAKDEDVACSCAVGGYRAGDEEDEE